MKKLIPLFAFIALSFALNAQFTVYNSTYSQNFYAIGGYSYTEQNFPVGAQAVPYILTGPSPENSFLYAVTSPTGISNSNNSIKSKGILSPITIQFKNNNVRKFGARIFGSIVGGGGTLPDVVAVVATSNLGNSATINCTNVASFAGFKVENENEYIVSIVASFTNIVAGVVAINDIIVGDDTPQNVAINFDGVNDYVALPSTVANFNYNQDYTVSVWVKPNLIQNETTFQDNEILEKWDGVANSYPLVLRYFNQTTASNGKVVWARYSPTSNVTITSTATINDGKWHHIAVTSGMNGTNRQFYMYIDGIQQGTVTDNTTGTNTNSVPLYVGQRGGGINHFTGEIDELRIWTLNKSQTEIENEMFCKAPNPTNLQAAYNFNNGVPNGNNALITQIQDKLDSNHGTLNNFAKTGNSSNFVTGQVKYVKANATGSNNGSSWANAFTDLQSALVANTCNDLVETWVAAGTYKPAASNVNASFIIPTGMQIYSGFAGTETTINQRNMALVHSTNKTTLSGDLAGNDTPFVFDASRNDNASYVVKINGGYVTFDGFTVSNGQSVGITKFSFGDLIISNCRIIDNNSNGLYLIGANSIISNCEVAGNNFNGIYIENNSSNFSNCLIANNGSNGIEQIGYENQTNLSNCTIVANGGNGIMNIALNNVSPTIINTVKNTIIKDNIGGNVNDEGWFTPTNNIIYSLIQGETSTANGNLDGNTTNPQFVSPLANTIISDAGDYRLKWCSKAIGAGTNTGISPLDLDRNPRNFGGTTDMGAYEFLGNLPSQVNSSSITGTIDSPTYAGGAIQTITSTAKVLAPAGAIDFKAPNSITLNPGFEARGVGKYFQAQIGANETCVN